MNPYSKLVNEFARLVKNGDQYPLGGVDPLPRVNLPPDAPKALIFSPHPDDEVIIGGMALRLLREMKMKVINVAVTQGSNRARQAARLQELTACCQHIGFDLLQTQSNGLEGINPQTRKDQPDIWRKAVERIAQILQEQRPAILFAPHDDDWNSTHIGTHHLVMDALATLDPDFSCTVVETEFWGAMDTPNLMVESSAQDVTDLITALTFHVGEVRRNPYHLRMAAWMIDNVRRGGELVGGQGGAAPDFAFGTLYRLRQWRDGGLHEAWTGGKFVTRNESLATLLEH
jgi:LmbE family N-acetylglucosaminyl deacetylase